LRPHVDYPLAPVAGPKAALDLHTLLWAGVTKPGRAARPGLARAIGSGVGWAASGIGTDRLMSAMGAHAPQIYR
jgi:hypothetical protein